MKDARKRRLADFDERSKLDPEAHRETELGSYVAVNPMADEDELLKSLDLPKSGCVKVDCYWKIDGDVYFLQVETFAYANRELGLWARVSPGDPPHTNLLGVVDEDVITRDAVHRVMRLFAKSSFRTSALDESLTRIGDS